MTWIQNLSLNILNKESSAINWRRVLDLFEQWKEMEM